jgi:PPOX class probable F420-dependent enzyme
VLRNAKLEVVVLPVSDVDAAKEFYVDRVGFHLDVDHAAGDDFRIVQLTPVGSGCSVTLMRNPESAGSVQGLHLVVTDIEVAHAELVAGGVEVSEPFHFGPTGQTPGLHPERADFGTFVAFADPDGNSWMVQERRRRISGGPGIELPGDVVDLLRRPVSCYLATTMPDGSPQLTLTWVDTDGTDVLVNTVQGHQKLRNIDRDPRVVLNVSDPAAPSRYVGIRGTVVETTTDGAADHIEVLAQRYLGGPYPWFGGRDQVRVLVRIRPERLHRMG